MTIKTINFCSTKPGKHLVIFGAVHGHEKCGTAAINIIIDEINNNKIQIDNGQVTFVPIANPQAYEKNVRFVERNLNRHLYPKDEPIYYEDFLTPIICKILDNADALLDIHSYQALGGPFGFLGTSSEEELNFCRSLGVSDFVYGWSEAFSSNNSNDNIYESMGTTEYTRYKGGIAVTIECGHHNNSDNVDVAYRAIKGALSFMSITNEEGQEGQSESAILSAKAVQSDPLQQQYRCIKMQSVFYKEKSGNFIKKWKHYDFVAKDTIIAIYDDGTEIIAPSDGYLVLPKENTDHPVGAEWFYFGIATDFPEPS